MKKKYEGNISLICKSCGSKDIAVSEDNSYAKCNACQKEYKDGNDELVRLNQSRINAGVEKMKKEIVKDAQEELNKMIRKTFGSR